MRAARFTPRSVLVLYRNEEVEALFDPAEQHLLLLPAPELLIVSEEARPWS
ncbi:MAG TPA: hypothetical protein VF620_12725 [Allosphingosinicella sp.]|jgi:hypothetical protein